jgi:hypothetical protein
MANSYLKMEKIAHPNALEANYDCELSLSILVHLLIDIPQYPVLSFLF